MDLSHYVKRVKFNLVDLNIVQYGEIHCFEFRTSYCEKRKRHLTAYIYEFGQYQLVYSFDIYNPLQKATCEFYFDEHVIYKKTLHHTHFVSENLYCYFTIFQKYIKENHSNIDEIKFAIKHVLTKELKHYKYFEFTGNKHIKNFVFMENRNVLYGMYFLFHEKIFYAEKNFKSLFHPMDIFMNFKGLPSKEDEIYGFKVKYNGHAHVDAFKCISDGPIKYIMETWCFKNRKLFFYDIVSESKQILYLSSEKPINELSITSFDIDEIISNSGNDYFATLDGNEHNQLFSEKIVKNFLDHSFYEILEADPDTELNDEQLNQLKAIFY